MKQVLIRINSGHVRLPPHDIDANGVQVLCTTLRVPVTLTDKPPKQHNGKTLLCVLDSKGEEHWIDEWFIDQPEPASDVPNAYRQSGKFIP